MENVDDEDDLKLVKASAALLLDLEASLPKILWRTHTYPRATVHTQVKQQDLDHLVKLIEPFQGEPQLIDAKLKSILPLVVDAYITSLQSESSPRAKHHLPFESAVCILLYTLCKVRGYKVIVGFLNNEPRYLEPILARLEDILANNEEHPTEWQVSYILLLWLAHLLLTPFDLASLSDPGKKQDRLDGLLQLQHHLPSAAERALLVGLTYLPVSTKAQDAAAMLLVRLIIRSDMQKLQVADAVVAKALESLEEGTSDTAINIYQKIGPLRLLAGICAAPELSHLVPGIYHLCLRLVGAAESSVWSNAVAKKLVVKTLRNIATLSLRPSPALGPLADFLETTNVLEDVIDYLLRSLGDRDTPVRYAAAKGLSTIILQLEPDMGHEVVQAILDSFQEDAPHHSDALDFRAANALKWHGLTLALAHTLFKRSASPDQLPDIVQVLVLALQFEQRTATGSSVGTNVRDAANFGIWSLSRRYTTAELLSVTMVDPKGIDAQQRQNSVIQSLATQLILSACLDPAGNIRRGSSAALQEIIGRHPDQISNGIALVQIVDYQAVGLRRRAMLDVASRAAELHIDYWTSLVTAMFEWRGIGSSDVTSREAAAASLARLSYSEIGKENAVLRKVVEKLRLQSANDVEGLHGLVLSLANLFTETTAESDGLRGLIHKQHSLPDATEMQGILHLLLNATKDFSLRMLRSELPSVVVHLLAALCRRLLQLTVSEGLSWCQAVDSIELLTERMLARHEDTILHAVPALGRSLLALKRELGVPTGFIDAQILWQSIAVDGAKSSLQGAGRAIALGTLIPLYGEGLVGDTALTAVNTLGNLTSAMSVEWRIIGVKALQLTHESKNSVSNAEPRILEVIAKSLHRAMNDYTIDERGDVGSLVRLQGITCTTCLFANRSPGHSDDIYQTLQADILRLSLEKLDRVRLAACQCLHDHLGFEVSSTDFAGVSSRAYFDLVLRPLAGDSPTWKHRAILEGLISCAGISAEPVLQASRAALADILWGASTEQLLNIMSIFSTILKSMLLDGSNMHPALELLAFLLDLQIPARVSETDFKWRNLLSTVQKSHHKSNDIPKILAAVNVYRGLADVSIVRQEVMNKLINVLKTNPYPRVRVSVAEVLFLITKDQGMKQADWLKPPSQNLGVLQSLAQRGSGT